MNENQTDAHAEPDTEPSTFMLSTAAITAALQGLLDAIPPVTSAAYQKDPEATERTRQHVQEALTEVEMKSGDDGKTDIEFLTEDTNMTLYAAFYAYADQISELYKAKALEKMLGIFG
jgi:hypothetical protein